MQHAVVLTSAYQCEERKKSTNKDSNHWGKINQKQGKSVRNQPGAINKFYFSLLHFVRVCYRKTYIFKPKNDFNECSPLGKESL